MCHLSRNSGSLQLLDVRGPLQAFIGILDKKCTLVLVSRHTISFFFWVLVKCAVFRRPSASFLLVSNICSVVSIDCLCFQNHYSHLSPTIIPESKLPFLCRNSEITQQHLELCQGFPKTIGSGGLPLGSGRDFQETTRIWLDSNTNKKRHSNAYKTLRYIKDAMIHKRRYDT